MNELTKNVRDRSIVNAGISVLPVVGRIVGRYNGFRGSLCWVVIVVRWQEMCGVGGTSRGREVIILYHTI